MISSFRASAMRITLGAFPAFSRRSANAASTAPSSPAAYAPRYNTRRTADRPPPIKRFPFQRPLSRFTGATPTKAATCSREMVPNSGNSANSVRLVTDRDARDRLQQLHLWPSRPTRLDRRRQFPVGLPDLLVQHPQDRLVTPTHRPIRRRQPVRSIVRISINWFRRATNACNSWASAPANGRTGGRTRSANCANTSASNSSVLARRPNAPAKSRTCLGLTRLTGRPFREGRDHRAFVPPVASMTTSVGANGSNHATSAAIPSGVLSKRRAAPSGRRCVSSDPLETSMPTNR